MHIRGQEISWKTLAGIVVAAALSALPAIQSGNLEGMSEILAVAYALVWAATATRLGFHVYEGYIWCGLWRETLFELAIVIAWGCLALRTIQAEDPQIPQLVACGAIASIAFFVGSTEMEEARADLAKEGGIRPRRATDVLRDSWLWSEICNRSSRLDSEKARRVRRWFSGRDAADGMLSRAAFIALCSVAAIAIAAGSLAIVGTVLGKPLTPEHISDSGEEGAEGDLDPPADDGGGFVGGVRPRQQEISEVPQARSDDECGTAFDPDSEVPEPQRSALMLAWHEVDGILPGPLEALGSDIAGCPGEAQQIPNKPGWWYVPGDCEGQLRAIAIAPAGMEHPVVMLEQGAEFALPLIAQGEFVGAVDRFGVGDGDAYVVNATAGSIVLIREHNTAGPVEGHGGGSGGCDDFADEDVPYTVVKPMLIPGWRSAAAISKGGVYPLGSAHNTGAVESVMFHSPAGIVAEGRCWAVREICGVKIGDSGEWIIGEAGTRTNQEEVEALVEP